MGKLRDLVVKFSGLSIGTHHFEFALNDRFFEQLEDSLIRSGDVKVMMTLEKKSTHLELSFTLGGEVGETCDRCAVDYRQSIEGEFRMFVKFGDAFEEVDDELMTVPHGTYELDVSQMVYEFIGLSIPLRKVPCETTGDTSVCDRAVLDRISEPLTDNESHSPFKAILGNLKDRMN
ncbi:MAG: DUF177 domain-containing protein [Flavobacteriales bacterium]|nr:DUF177 domain-containing protein [Flavobacteriales bacterium]